MSEPGIAARRWTGKRWVLLTAAVVAVAAGAWVLWPTLATPSANAPTASGVGQTLTDDGAGGVTFKATLKARQPGTLFTVTLDTHTVDLGAYDLRSIMLRGASGDDITPSEVRIADGRTSHHIEADLTFPSTQGSVTLVAKDLGGVPERRLVFS